MTKLIKGIFAAVVAIVVVWVFCSLAEDTDKSKNYVCQYPITGKYDVWTEGGLQWQVMGNVQEYSKTSQIDFTSLEESSENHAASLTFSDKGRGYIIGSFRVVLPTDNEHMKKIQRDFGSERALINNLVRPTLYKVVTSCGPLMTSLQSVSETRTDLIEYITDQLNNGVYKTKSIKVEQTNDITGEKETVVQSERIGDENAPMGFKRQEVSPFSQYGITCGLVSITDIKYDATTQDQIDAQKQANLAVITAKTKAVEAQQKTILLEEQGKAAAAEAKWRQEKEKAVAVTKAEQEREVSRLAAEKAEFDKKKIIAEGQAEAEANRLKVQAGLTPQERVQAEIQMNKDKWEAISHIKVPIVPTNMISTSGRGNSGVDLLGDAKALETLMGTVAK